MAPGQSALLQNCTTKPMPVQLCQYPHPTSFPSRCLDPSPLPTTPEVFSLLCPQLFSARSSLSCMSLPPDSWSH